jgi:hypothetical protein
MNDMSASDQKPTYAELLQQNDELQQSLAELRVEKYQAWNLFFEVGRRLQVSSASIKAAVSSLLDPGIFWNPANQHEFLQTIDKSVDRSSRLVVLLTLAFRAEAGKLELQRESQEFQEIMAIIQADITNKYPDLVGEFTLPTNGGQVIADYEYLIIALKYIFEFLNTRKAINKLDIVVVFARLDLILKIHGLDQSTKILIETMQACKTDESLVSEYPALPEFFLGLHVACEILHLQEIDLTIVEEIEGNYILSLHIPTHHNTNSTG